MAVGGVSTDPTKPMGTLDVRIKCRLDEQAVMSMVINHNMESKRSS